MLTMLHCQDWQRKLHIFVSTIRPQSRSLATGQVQPRDGLLAHLVFLIRKKPALHALHVNVNIKIKSKERIGSCCCFVSKTGGCAMPSKTRESLKCKISIRLTWRGGRRYVLRTVLRADDFVEPKFLMVLRWGRALLIKISKKKGWPRSPRPTPKSVLFFQNTIIPGAYDTRCGPSKFFL